VAVAIVLGAAMSGAVVVPVGNVAGQRHVPARHFQELLAFGGVAQPLGRSQAALGHSLVLFTPWHGNPHPLCRILNSQCTTGSMVP
jgi:hypothetical protein